MDIYELEKLRSAIRAEVSQAVSASGLTKANTKLTPGDSSNYDNGEYKSFGEFLATVKNKPNDGRLVKALSEGTDTLGGFLVPQQYAKDILLASLEKAIIRRFAFVIPMSSDTINIPRIVDTTHASDVYGGLKGVWTEEAGAGSVDEPTFGQVKLIAHKLMLYTETSNELLADSAIALEALLLKLFGDTLAWEEDWAFIRGNGVGQPLGILNSGALLTINRSAATTVALADIANMQSRLLPQSYESAIWLANPSVLPQLAVITATALAWLSSDQGLAKPMPTTVLGRPLFITEKCSALGTAGDIMLIDPSFYVIGDRKTMELKASEQFKFSSDQTAWRMVERVAGQPWVDSKFTPRYGSTLSPFVCLSASTTGGD